MSLPTVIRHLPISLPLSLSLSLRPSTALRLLHTTPSHPAIFGKPTPGEDAAAEQEAARRALLAARERERQAALEAAATLDPGQLDPDAIPETSIVLPGDLSMAPTPAEAQKMAYVAAESLEELEEVEGLAGWWDREGHWGEESQVEVFAMARTGTGAAEVQGISDEVVTVLVRQAVAETLVVKAKGEAGDLVKRWARVGKEVAKKAATVTVEVRDGQLVMTGEVDEVLKALKSTEGVTVGEEMFTQEEAEELVKTFDKTWKKISLEDPSLKFAVTKRVYQLTGHRISDSRLLLCPSVGHLLTYLLKPAKPTSVIEALRSEQKLQTLPNVRVYSRRVTPIDRRIQDGSWKKIEEELRKRKLPVVGHEHLPDAAEKKWIAVKY